MIHLGDITQIYGHNIPPVDVITFGSPCQDLSVAGKRAGLGGERSGLFSEAIRIIQEMRDATNGKHPAFAVWENVPGAYSSNRGEDFRNVLQGLVSLCGDTIPIPGPAGRWLTAGEIMGDNYSIAWRTMDAQYWGVPQRRRRIALVVDFGGGRASKILFDAESLPGDPQPGKSEKKGAPRNSGSGINMAEGSLCGGFKGRVSAGQVCHVVYDARGNGSGGCLPYNYRRPPKQGDGLYRDMCTGEYHRPRSQLQWGGMAQGYLLHAQHNRPAWGNVYNGQPKKC